MRPTALPPPATPRPLRVTTGPSEALKMWDAWERYHEDEASRWSAVSAKCAEYEKAIDDALELLEAPFTEVPAIVDLLRPLASDG